MADVSQGGSEVAVGGEGVVFVTATLLREATFLALLFTVGVNVALPLDVRAFFARMLGPTSSRAPLLSGLLRLRATEGDSMAG